MEDIVGKFIDVKKQIKALEEHQAALETIIFSNDEHRKDDRIKIVAGKKTMTLKPETYEILNTIGIEVSVTETRFKTLEEFDIDVQKTLLENPDNFNIKISKESIRLK